LQAWEKKVIKMELIATTKPVKYAPNWGSDGFQILKFNKNIRKYSKIKPGCDHSGCVVYFFILGNREEYFKKYTELQEAFEKMQKVVENQPFCGNLFATVRKIG
jgi:hypothetical protein